MSHKQQQVFTAAALLLVLVQLALCQRSSPQFSFPPPGPVGDVFTSSNGQDNSGLASLQSLTNNNNQQQAQLIPLGAQQSAFSPIATSQVVADTSLLLNQAPQLIASSQQQQQQSQVQPIAPVAQPILRQQQPQEPTIERRPQQQQHQNHNTQSQQHQQQQQHQRSSQQQQPQASGSSVSASQSQSQAQAQQQQQQPRPRQVAQSTHREPQHKVATHVQTAQQVSSSAAQSHNHHHTQHTSQSATGLKEKEAAIESARRAEATAASLAAASGQQYHCPDSFGYFRHHKSCDKYWACDNGTATLKLCGNGLMFDDSDPKRENCAYPFSVDCGSDRTDLEPPISTPHCPRLYGLFADTSNCRVFYSCWNGESSKYECPPGLAYDNEQRVCVWADLVDRCDQSEVSDGFVCPDPTEVDQPGHYTRHAHPTDCRKFYVCIEGVARPYGCSIGTVFNVDSLQCDEPENVSGCEKYYGDLDPKTAKKLAFFGTDTLEKQSPNQPPSTRSNSNSAGAVAASSSRSTSSPAAAANH